MSRTYVHPLPVRIWHWVNAVTFIILSVTGFQIRYRDLVAWMNFNTACTVHNLAAIILTVAWIFWFSYYLGSGTLRIYLPVINKAFFDKTVRQAKFYGFGIMVGEQNPHHMTLENKFNPMQQLTYAVIMLFFVPAQILSGLVLFDMEQLHGYILAWGGVKMVATTHAAIFMFFMTFMFGHAYLATLGHTVTAHFKAMITGYEE